MANLGKDRHLDIVNLDGVPADQAYMIRADFPVVVESAHLQGYADALHGKVGDPPVHPNFYLDLAGRLAYVGGIFTAIDVQVSAEEILKTSKS